MKCGTAVEYANKRVRDQLARFHFLCDAAAKNDVEERKLIALEQMDNLFPFLDYRIYAEPERAAEQPPAAKPALAG